MSEVAHIGLGSNLGDRVGAMLEALERLDAADGISVGRVSTLIESEAVGMVDQPCFVNAAAELRVDRSPREVLAIMLAVETAMGRRRRADAVPTARTIDLDLLLWGDRIIDLPNLTVPHPRLHERAFVLVPMVEIAHDRVHPALAATMETLLTRDVGRNGPVEDRCRMLLRSALQEEGGLRGPRMEEDR